MKTKTMSFNQVPIGFFFIFEGALYMKLAAPCKKKNVYRCGWGRFTLKDSDQVQICRADIVVDRRGKAVAWQ